MRFFEGPNARVVSLRASNDEAWSTYPSSRDPPWRCSVLAPNNGNVLEFLASEFAADTVTAHGIRKRALFEQGRVVTVRRV